MTQNDKPAPSGRKRGQGVQFVYDRLRDDILSLARAPGSPIDEGQIAQQLSMSRTPVREALVRLAGDGLVTTLPNRSTVVTNIDVLDLNSFFDALTLMYRVTTRLAAKNHDAKGLRHIRALQTAFAAAVENHDALAMIATNREFHAAIAEAGGNPYFTGLFCRLLDEGRRLLRIYYSSFNDHLPRRYVDEHEDIIAAIEARDIDAADRLAARHADQIVHQIQRMFARDERDHVPL